MDTIFALASAPGRSGVAVVRVSGDRSWEAVKALAGSVPEPRRMVLRTLRDRSGVQLDEAMVVAFAAGASFTGEESAEFHLHGSIAVVRAVLAELALVDGCRPAQPGEFTRRALENGCMDFTQVEALADLIEAETEAQRKQALAVLSGALSGRVSEWRQKLVRAASLLEVTIDFVDEDVPVDVTDEVIGLLKDVLSDIQSELRGLDAAERVRLGFEVAIVGPPNAGKSTLLNHLAGRDAAITSEIAGTTRDVIEVRMEVGGLPVTFLDTAGLRETQDPVERLGIDLARRRAEAADLRVHLVEHGGQPEIEVRCGDVVRWAKDDSGVYEDGLSGRTGFGVPLLLSRIEEVLSERTAGMGLTSRERHRDSLIRSRTYLEQAVSGLEDGMSEVDILSEDIRLGIRQLEVLVGKVEVEHLLDEIFSSFCIGK
ncbi:tRNA uridine-5-carboxymethylaminomethyl(34) synthesis GTPase MnmE [Sagittula sp.]|uniref:tRNA uridine-5-carboxymethylaminomethyl(34) synthesis GTPase MnmE n=1 Tax=Sagittula sp. TaxID=2038081 RepID=UPI0035175CC7